MALAELGISHETEPGLSKVAYVFTGQGSQFVGMGKELYRDSKEARDVFDRASSVLGYDMPRLCFEDPNGQLDSTEFTQPAIYTVSMARYARFHAENPDDIPTTVAGHSMGEMGALTVNNVISFDDGLQLLRSRGRFMQEAPAGAMGAILGLQEEVLETICEGVEYEEQGDEEGGIVMISNRNAEGNYSISGKKKSVLKALERAKAKGARLTLPLKISIGSHSKLMEPARVRLAQFLESLPFSSSNIPIVMNGNIVRSLGEIKMRLASGLTEPVDWIATVNAMAKMGVNEVVEFGPKDILTGFIKRIDPNVKFRKFNERNK